ncbi:MULTISPECIES: hypothetical protein [unclassified Robiginitalea]|uniref:hypothetical protein n=1 Tax=Robiginitalea TaxID=252306 RepID=UPI00234B35FB|nr:MULTISPECIES: hypothetical protein [unclassified Robiginitalea]MDC6353288.1 hypothetical protein [Robiginitalea sp. PM2]MDC6373546.1 hypothetical protein [Robiginitalea sp. SP8]
MEIKSSPDSCKRPAIRIRLGMTLLAGFLAGSLQAQQQCAVFKSEISDVRKFEQTVNQLTDSLKVYAEVAAFAARYTEGRSNAQKVEFLAGEALAAAQEAVNYAAEAQYHAEVCGMDAVITHAIEAEALSIDVRDFAETMYTNARKASAAGKLGDIHYYMRRSLQAAREATRISEKATWAALDAHGSCTHEDDMATGKN